MKQLLFMIIIVILTGTLFDSNDPEFWLLAISGGLYAGIEAYEKAGVEL